MSSVERLPSTRWRWVAACSLGFFGCGGQNVALEARPEPPPATFGEPSAPAPSASAPPPEARQSTPSVTDTRSPKELIAAGRAGARDALAAKARGDAGAEQALAAAAELIERGTGTKLALRPGRALKSVRDLKWSPDGRTLAAADEGDVVLLDATTLAQTARLSLSDPEHPVIEVGFDGDGALVAGASFSAYAKVWDVTSGKVQAETQLNVFPPASFALTPDGKSFAEVTDHATLFGSLDNELEYASFATGDEETQWHWTKKGRFHRLEFARDGKSLLVSGNGRVSIFDTATGQLKKSFGVPKVFRAARSADQKLIATISLGNSIQIWDAAAPTRPKTLSGHRARVYAIAFSPDSKFLLSGADDQRFILWEIASQKPLYEHAMGWTVERVAFSSDGAKLAVGSWEEVVIWDRATWTSIAAKKEAEQCAAGELLFPHELCEVARDRH